MSVVTKGAERDLPWDWVIVGVMEEWGWGPPHTMGGLACRIGPTESSGLRGPSPTAPSMEEEATMSAHHPEAAEHAPQGVGRDAGEMAQGLRVLAM